jgi:FkbM family methyltransferase
MFTSYIVNNPDCLIIDIGAQIGQYTLFGAKLGNHVISVEPFYENVLRIHKAAKLNNLETKILLIQNAISNRRNEIKLLQKVDSNIGGQSLLENFDKEYDSIKSKSNEEYLVETILFDDILDVIQPLRTFYSNQTYRKAIMKIDIEGFEPYAFQYAKNLFKKLDFVVIFMEWGVLSRHASRLNLLCIQMINFLYANNMRPYVYDESGTKVLLDREKWRTDWPWDIFWENLNYQIEEK